MEIRDFSGRIRIGHGFPSTIDVEPINGHEVFGVKATCFTYKGIEDRQYVQFRKHNKDEIVGLFAFSHDEVNVPECWENSTVIWDSRTPDQKSKEATPDE